MKTCRIEVCDKPAEKKRTLCSGHRKRKQEGRPLDSPIKSQRSPKKGQDVMQVLKDGSLNGGVTYACWIWDGYKRPDKGKTAANVGTYGRVSINGVNDYAHRHAYKATFGDLPEDKPQVRHLCNNPPCCNPSHLVAGDRTTQAQDAVKAGTHYSFFRDGPVEEGSVFRA